MADEDGGFDAIDGRNDGKSRRGRPWDTLIRKFFRKGRGDPVPETVRTSGHSGSALFCIRSRSASDMSSIDIPIERSNRSPILGDAYANGLAISHDSVFAGEPQDSADEDEEAVMFAPKQILLSNVQDELRAALLRRQTKVAAAMTESEEDLGLPRSPASVSPPSRDPLGFHRRAGYGLPFSLRSRKGSYGSMLSMDYVEPDEETGVTMNPISRQNTMDDGMPQPEPDGDAGASFPLNHAAARHKMAVRPKRAHVPSRARNLQQLAAVEETPSAEDEPIGMRARPAGLPPVRGSVRRVDSRRSSSQVRPPTQPPDLSPKLRSVSLTRSGDRSPSPPTSPTPPSRVARSRSSAEKKLLHESESFRKRNAGATVANPVEEKKVGSEAPPAESQNIFSRFFPRRRSSRKNSTEIPTTRGTPVESGVPALPPKGRDLARKNSFVEDKETKSPEEPRKSENRRFSREIDFRPDNSAESETTNFTSFFDRIREGNRNATKPVLIPRKNPPKETSPKGDDKGYESLDVTPDFLQPRKFSREETVESNVRPWVKVLPTLNINDFHRPSDEHADELAGKFKSEPRRQSDENEASAKFRKQISAETPREVPFHPARRVNSFRGAKTEPLSLDQLPPVGKDKDMFSKGSSIEKSSGNLEKVDLNSDFILKKPDQPNPAAPVIRRSLETLKFSNEGLKKTINSLSRHSQSSDQLVLSDDSAHKNSNDSLSTGSSSLNISDTEGLGSSYSISRESLDKITEKLSIVIQPYSARKETHTMDEIRSDRPKAGLRFERDATRVESSEAFSSLEFDSMSPKKSPAEPDTFFETTARVQTPTTPVIFRSFAEPFSPPEIKLKIVSETAQVFKAQEQMEKKLDVVKEIPVRPLDIKEIPVVRIPVQSSESQNDYPDVILRKPVQTPADPRGEESKNLSDFDLDLKSSVFGLHLKSKFSEMRHSGFRQEEMFLSQPQSLDSSVSSDRQSTTVFEIPVLRKTSLSERENRNFIPKKEETRPVKPDRASLLKRVENSEEFGRIQKVDGEIVEAKRPTKLGGTDASELFRVFARRSLKLRDVESTVTESRTEDHREKLEEIPHKKVQLVESSRTAPPPVQKSDEDTVTKTETEKQLSRIPSKREELPKAPPKILVTAKIVPDGKLDLPRPIFKENEPVSVTERLTKRLTIQPPKLEIVESSKVEPVQIQLNPSPVLIQPKPSPVLIQKDEPVLIRRVESTRESKRIELKIEEQNRVEPENKAVEAKEVIVIPKEKPSPRAVRLRSKTLPDVNYADMLVVKPETVVVEPKSITAVPAYGVQLRPTGNVIVNRALRVESGLDGDENNIWKRISSQQKLTNVADKISEESEVAKRFASRQSKVLDIVNNFQRLQVT